jgi:hypothetical protein
MVAGGMSRFDERVAMNEATTADYRSSTPRAAIDDALADPQRADRHREVRTRLAAFRAHVDAHAKAREQLADNPEALGVLDRYSRWSGESVPPLSAAVRTLMTDICPHCHRSEIEWYGGQAYFEEQLSL